MSVAVGFTAAEVRELVYEYSALPRGAKASWLDARSISYGLMRRWRSALFEGDLDRALIPREASPVTVPPRDRTSIARMRASERVTHEVEIAKLNARVRELEQTNEALGKAIGLLHQMSEQEPDATPTRTGPSASSTPKTNSSPT